jgi:hypothetical protein
MFIIPIQRASTPVSPRDISKPFFAPEKVELSISVNICEAKRSLTEYGAYPYAAGDLFAFDGKNILL